MEEVAASHPLDGPDGHGPEADAAHVAGRGGLSDVDVDSVGEAGVELVCDTVGVSPLGDLQNVRG